MSLPPMQRMRLIYLCGNYLGALKIDELNRAFDLWVGWYRNVIPHWLSSSPELLNAPFSLLCLYRPN